MKTIFFPHTESPCSKQTKENKSKGTMQKLQLFRSIFLYHGFLSSKLTTHKPAGKEEN